MEKKKLGLSGKSKLELSKTVRGGTVRQSFSHGRVKSVEVEVKKVRTFNKNLSNVAISEENKNISQDSYLSGRQIKGNDKDDSYNKERLQKLKEEKADGILDTSAFPKGSYILKLLRENGAVSTKKFLKE